MMSKLFIHRIFAFLIDELIISAIFLFINYDSLMAYMQNVDLSNSNSLEQITVYLQSMIIQIILIEAIYQFVFVYFYGASMGKILFKIKITMNGTKPNLICAITRAILRTFGKYFLLQLNFAWIFIDKDRLTLHDKLARTQISWSE